MPTPALCPALAARARGHGAVVTNDLPCWCGNGDLEPFSPDYRLCARCQTLVRRARPVGARAEVADAPDDFYGRQYWFSYQERQLGCPNIAVRARTDLAERCLYWLATALRYKLPPARVLEVGSGPGGFVAVLQAAGFEATGLELSPWVVRFIRDTFAVPVLLGPVETQNIRPASLDMVALLDVLEHLPDPVATMRHCLGLLKPDGCLLIQTPCFVEGRSHEAMVRDQDRFLEMLRPEDHLHLFSQRSLRDLFDRLGAGSVAFEPALFAEYDMFAVVSREPLPTHEPDAIAAALGARPASRLVQALLDIDAERRALLARYAEAEADRTARLAALEAQGQALGAADAERNALRAHAAALEERLRTLGEEVAAIEADRAARLEVIRAQGEEIGTLTGQRNDLRAELDALYRQVELLEADRAQRLEVIDGQARRLGDLEGQVTALAAQAGNLGRELAAISAERDALVPERDALVQERDALVRERDALVQERDMLMRERDALREMAGDIERSRVYRLLRRLGRWKRVARTLARARRPQ